MDDLELEAYKTKFENRMRDWGYFYPEYAGCELLNIHEDFEINGHNINPGSGDWVVNDIRGRSGTYGVGHEDYSIYKVNVKRPEKHGIDYGQKPIKHRINAALLMKRYMNIALLYMNWAHRRNPIFTNKELLNNTVAYYEKEKKVFAEDPYLALYWLNHFGATLDKRYTEVVNLIKEHNLVTQLNLLKEPLAFFYKTDAFYDMEIKGGYKSDKKDFEELFLIRRSYLVYFEQVYKNYEPENLDLWWKSITIYPKIEENLIVRMRWLKNNLSKCNNWTDFGALLEEKDENIPLLSYILACKPNTTDQLKNKYADKLVDELLKYKYHFKAPRKKIYGRVMLWDIKDMVSNKNRLQEAAAFYFQGDETCKEFQEIQSVLGIKDENIKVVQNAIETLNTAFEGYHRADTPAEAKLKYHLAVHTILDTLPAEILLKTLTNINNKDLVKCCFVYLWNAPFINKKEALIKLFIHLELTQRDVNKDMFGYQFPHLIKDENDPNIEIVKAFLNIPETNFRNNNTWKKSKKAAVKFFLTTVHLPKIFDFLIDTLKQEPTHENKDVLTAIYSCLFSEEYYTRINPTLKFSKPQIEMLLDSICECFQKYGYHQEASSVIYYCANPLAEEWLTQRLNTSKWLKKFAHISADYDTLDKELKEALESALKRIANEKNNS